MVADGDGGDSGRIDAVLLHRFVGDLGAVSRRGRGVGDLAGDETRETVARLRPLWRGLESKRAPMRFMWQCELDGQALTPASFSAKRCNFRNGTTSSFVVVPSREGVV